MTDFHDMEVMFFETPNILDEFLSTFIDSNKLKSFETTFQTSVKNVIYKLATEIAYLKLANNIYQLGLLFKPKLQNGKLLDYNQFICNQLNFLGKDKLITTVINFSINKVKNPPKEKKEIEKAYYEIIQKSSNYPHVHLLNGHDLSNILCLILKKVFKKTKYDTDDIESILSFRYTYEDFKKTKLYLNIDRWSNNKQCKILK
jgi:hypothetical protein